MSTAVQEIVFTPFPKLARLHRDIIITEKIDGTNAAVGVTEDGRVYAQSRKRLITPEQDNFGFATWVRDHADELRDGLGVGLHFGEWWGLGIQRGYGQDRKRFSLFNVGRWNTDERPACCDVVPTLTHSTGDRLNADVHTALSMLRDAGSAAAPGFMDPEGIVIFHAASRQLFKVTLDNDDASKWEQAQS